MNNSFVSHLKLFNFRNYTSKTFEFDSGVNVIYGKNGIGKTNILEAVSLLSPGRGLRKANLADIKNKTISVDNNPLAQLGEWFIYSKIEDDKGGVDEINTGVVIRNNRYSRTIKVNQKDTKDQSILNKYATIGWLTPQMDRLFNESTSTRRKFLDRIVYGIDPYHTTRVGNYEKLVRERIKLLTESVNPDTRWLGILEREIAELGVSISTSRISTLEYLNKALSMFDSNFPKAIVEVVGEVESLIMKGLNSLQVEEFYREQLFNNRKADSIVQKTQFGTHKTDMLVTYLEKNMEASLCSTGEQKLLLISIVLAKAKMYSFLNRPHNILLLDEIASYLDEGKRQQLFQEIQDLNCQCFLTGTSKELFVGLDASFVELG